MGDKTGTGSASLRFIPGKLHHLLSGKLVDIPCAKYKHFIQGQIKFVYGERAALSDKVGWSGLGTERRLLKGDGEAE